jgi:N-acetyl-anhydromuramyl-L-alanine amidase AmpD
MRQGLIFAVFAAACSTPLPPGELVRDGEPVDPGPHDAYAAAARVSGVAPELLMAISQVETRMQMVVGEAEFEGQDRAVGVMGLKESQLALAAELSDRTIYDLTTERAANIEAAAMLLAAYADEAGVDPSDLSAMAPVVARYSGIDNEEAAAEYVHYEVYSVLAEGLELEGMVMPGQDVAPDFRLPKRIRDPRKDESSAIWTPSPNYTSTRYGYDPEFVVIHTCEGSYSGCWGWLTNSASGVSAHYVVNDKGTEVRQLVDEDYRAWHVGASYDCDLNSGHDCGLDGITMNTLSVGIEHAGYASQSSWDDGLLDRSAELTCNITQRHGIPRDSLHIFGHGQIQPWSRTDPGPNWPWTDYLQRVQEACGDIPSSGGSSSGGSSGGATGLSSQFVIDSNTGLNTSRTWIDVGSAWNASANVAGYYNTGYWWARTEANSNLASFYFKTDASQCYTVDAWWTAASDRTDGTFIAYDTNGKEVGRSTVFMGSSGSRWNRLGDWTFPAGTNRVSLSRWGNGDGVVIADAIRLTECN